MKQKLKALIYNAVKMKSFIMHDFFVETDFVSGYADEY